jgi:hypothetical protein|nr:MAG TPA: hypothetical protein [Caudoviricetes sp.]
MKKQYHSQKSKQTNKKVMFKFDPKDNTVFETTVTSPNGNKNIFKIINAKNAPDIQQRIKD